MFKIYPTSMRTTLHMNTVEFSQYIHIFSEISVFLVQASSYVKFYHSLTVIDNKKANKIIWIT